MRTEHEADLAVLDLQGVQNGRELALEVDVDNGADHLCDAARDRSRGHGTNGCTYTHNNVLL